MLSIVLRFSLQRQPRTFRQRRDIRRVHLMKRASAREDPLLGGSTQSWRETSEAGATLRTVFTSSR